MHLVPIAVGYEYRITLVPQLRPVLIELARELVSYVGCHDVVGQYLTAMVSDGRVADEVEMVTWHLSGELRRGVFR